MSLKYKLMNNIDFEGATIHAFSAYATITTLVFKGVFDGQGYSLMNFKLATSKAAGAGVDVSLFGTVYGATTVIKNLSVIGAEIDACGGVIASRVHSGTIENCYVDVTVTGLNSVKAYYDIGAIAYCLQAGGSIKNCIATVKVAEGLDTTYVAGVVGWNAGLIDNCKAIVLTGEQLKVVTTGTGTVTNTEVYTSVEAFYENVDTTVYAEIWTFDENKQNLPHLGSVNIIESNVKEVKQGESVEVSVTSKLPVTYTLAETIEGVTLSSDGVLEVSSSVELGTTIKVNVSDYYGNSTVIELSVVELTLEVTSVENIVVAECITGESDSVVPHNINVTFNGETYTEGITYVSTNEAVATVDSTNVTILGEGTTIIKVLYNGVEIHSFTVTATVVYHAVRTVEDFKAIGTNLATMSLKYKLMNDIDFEGQEVNGLSAYGTVSTLVFNGVFDGQGYSFMNMKLAKSNWTGAGVDESLFGALWYDTTIIKNLSVIGAEIDSCGGVIASRVHSGTIENCYVEVTVTGTNNVKANYDIGAIAYCVQAAGIIKNCISTVTIAEGIDTTYL